MDVVNYFEKELNFSGSAKYNHVTHSWDVTPPITFNLSRSSSLHYPSNKDYMGDPIQSAGWHGVARTQHAAAKHGSIYDHMTPAGICDALVAGPVFRE